jgi:hypothetical protein
MQADGAARMTTSPNSTPDRSAQSARRDPFLALANEIERNPWWANSGEWDLPPEEGQDQRPPDGLRTPAKAARKPRKPSIATLIKRAEKSGRPVTSVMLPDGTTINFGEATSTDASNPWDVAAAALRQKKGLQ